MQHGWPALYTVLLWWFSTGVILYLNGLPRDTHKWTMAAATVLLGVSLLGVAASASDTRVTGAYLAFTAALMVWAWQEVGFLLGYVTGPRRLACPPGARGWRRVGHAVMAILYHELALIVLGAVIVALTWRQPNQLALWTFAVLWLMRLSAKLNVFLGVRNLSIQLMPEHLRYLFSYFRTARMNWLLPVSLIAASGVLIHLIMSVRGAAATPLFQVERTLVATILALAVLEHLFLALPVPDAVLFRWATRIKREQ